MRLILPLVIGITQLSAQTPGPTTDGAKMLPDEIAKQWQKSTVAPTPPVTRGFRTRGINPTAPAQPTSRTVSLSQEAVTANSDALESLRKRGVKIHKGTEAVVAQKVQDSQSQRPPETPGTETSTTTVQMPVAAEKQIAFRLHFQQNSTELEDAESRQMISKIAEAMKSVPDKIFLLEGHTCDLGDSAYNQHLSEKRALVVREILQAQGISAARLLSIGQGEKIGTVPNTSDENRALNRRVMIGPIEVPQ